MGVGGRQAGATLPGQALGTENKVLCLILPMTLKARCHYYFIFAGEEGGLRKVKWFGQGCTAGVCHKWGSHPGVFNRLYGSARGDPWLPDLPLTCDRYLPSSTVTQRAAVLGAPLSRRGLGTGRPRPEMLGAIFPERSPGQHAGRKAYGVSRQMGLNAS